MKAIKVRRLMIQSIEAAAAVIAAGAAISALLTTLFL
jgi:hypothetical protein